MGAPMAAVRGTVVGAVVVVDDSPPPHPIKMSKMEAIEVWWKIREQLALILTPIYSVSDHLLITQRPWSGGIGLVSVSKENDLNFSYRSL